MSFRNVLLGTAMLSMVRILRLIAQFVVIPILSRILSPAEYGLVAIAMPFALFAMMLADAGIGMSLVHTPQSERKVWSTCFWLATMLGALFGMALLIAGPLAAYFFHEPQLSSMIMALAFAVFAQSVHLIPVAAMQQAQRFRVIAGVELLATMLGLITAVIVAYRGGGAWAIIAQQLIFFGVRMCVMTVLSGFRPLFVFQWSEVREHLLFGRNVLGNAMINYFSRSFDSWVVGRALGATLLGYYSMAMQFARLPILIVAGPLQYALYPQLTKMKGNSEAISRVFLVATRLLAVLVFPVMGLGAVAHTPIFAFLLSEKWKPASELFMILAPACALQTVIAIGETVVYALGHTQVQLRTSTEYCIFWIGTLLIAVQISLYAAAVAFLLSTIAYHVRYLLRIAPLLGLIHPLRQYAKACVVPLIATGFAIGLYEVLMYFAALENWSASILAAIIALGTGCISLLVQKHELLDEMRAWKMEYTQVTSDTKETVESSL